MRSCPRVYHNADHPVPLKSLHVLHSLLTELLTCRQQRQLLLIVEGRKTAVQCLLQLQCGSSCLAPLQQKQRQNTKITVHMKQEAKVHQHNCNAYVTLRQTAQPMRSGDLMQSHDKLSRDYAHSEAGLVMSSDSRFVMSVRSSAAAETCGCAAASFWLSLGGCAAWDGVASATSASMLGGCPCTKGRFAVAAPS